MLYAIGDLHLSFGTNKPMDVFGGGWSDYIEKLRAGFSRLTSGDVCVLCGDISWAMSFTEAVEDFRFINDIPGKKIILKGNHDYWWSTAAKMRAFLDENGFSDIEILNNNCFYYEGYAICGTRGWMMETGEDMSHNEKITRREAGRLRASLQAADGAAEKLCFFHYPPRYKDLVSNGIVDVMNEFGVRRCWYGHLHGLSHRCAVQGDACGIVYKLVSADYLGFTPLPVDVVTLQTHLEAR